VQFIIYHPDLFYAHDILMRCTMKGKEWNVKLLEGPIKSLRNDEGTFPVLKGGKAVLKGLVMNMNAEQVAGAGGAGNTSSLKHTTTHYNTLQHTTTYYKLENSLSLADGLNGVRRCDH
jgi:hypothetical protein